MAKRKERRKDVKQNVNKKKNKEVHSGTRAFIVFLSVLLIGLSLVAILLLSGLTIKSLLKGDTPSNVINPQTTEKNSNNETNNQQIEKIEEYDEETPDIEIDDGDNTTSVSIIEDIENSNKEQKKEAVNNNIIKSEENIQTTKTHTVVKGDTLWDIAEMYYGNGFHWVEILKKNQEKIGFLPNGEQALIIPGQILWLP
jgi:nucleoid-associated protein YgaU